MNGAGSAAGDGAMDAESALMVSMHLPMEWRPVSAESVLVDGTMAHASLRTLMLALSLGERGPGLPAEDASGIEQEIQRMHHKVQLLTELVSAVLAAQQKRPAPGTVRFNSERIEWQADELPQAMIGIVALWLHPAVPDPLLWPARISDHQCLGNGRHLVVADLLPLGEAVEEALQRWIFQLHRRAVADARAAARTATTEAR